MMKPLIRSFLLSLVLGPLAVMAGEAIDINNATAAQLEQINGIGPAKAQAIVDYRTKHGPFKSVDELEKVPGIGAKLLEKIKPHVTAKAASAASKK